MPTFPTLSRNPAEIEEDGEDSTIRSPYEAGYRHTRPRYTRDRLKWRVYYPALTASDKAAIESLLSTTRNGADSFDWEHPLDGSAGTYTVQFEARPVFRSVGPDIWETRFRLLEV